MAQKTFKTLRYETCLYRNTVEPVYGNNRATTNKHFRMTKFYKSVKSFEDKFEKHGTGMRFFTYEQVVKRDKCTMVIQRNLSHFTHNLPHFLFLKLSIRKLSIIFRSVCRLRNFHNVKNTE